MRTCVVVGNPKPASRTRDVAEAVAARFGGADRGASRTIELAEFGADLLDPNSSRVAELTALVSGVDVVIVASPTYKGTFTGLLKLFLDRLPPSALSGVITAPVMLAGGPHHAHAVETSLRPLLRELGSPSPLPGLCVLEAQMGDLPSVVDAWWANIEAHARLLSSVVGTMDPSAAGGRPE